MAVQIGLLTMFLATGALFFATIMYFPERDEEHTKFTSIPASLW